MRRPLTYTAVVFVMVLLLLQGWEGTLLKTDPVTCNEYGEKSLYEYMQGDRITICGTVRDYSCHEQYEQITTELILHEIYLLSQKEHNSKEKIPKLISKPGQTIIVYMNQMEKTGIGGRVIVEGNLSFWKPATNPGEFDAENFYSNRDVLFGIKKAELIKVSTEENRLLQWLKEFRFRQEDVLKRCLPEENSAIMRAMLFGNKKEMEEETKSLYQNNGIAHVLAISGLHISLIGMSVFRMLQYLPIRQEIVLAGSEIFLLLYGCMVGFSASSFRAVFMFTFFLLAKVLKRSYDMITAMAVSAVVQLLIHPGYLYDCGFQLSYGSIIGIGILLPALEAVNETIPNQYIKRILGAFLPSLSVTLITAPVLIYHYHELSVFSIVLNFIVLPLMAPLLVSGIVLLMAGNLVELAGGEILIGLSEAAKTEGAADVIGWLMCNGLSCMVNGILWIFEMGCRFLEWLPIGRYNIAAVSVPLMILYYGILLLMTILVKRKQHVYQLSLLLMAAGILTIPGKPEFSAWALDVGQGDCNVIFDDGGNCFIIDCGSTTKNKVGEKILIPFLKYHGADSVEAVFITHSDEDHMGGILELLEQAETENITVKSVVVWNEAKGKDVHSADEWTELLQTADANGIPVTGILQGDRICSNDVTIECMYPLRGQSGLEGNEASLVLELVTAGGFRALYTGDLESGGEKLLLENRYNNRRNETGNPVKPYDLLKVGHHGSNGSSSKEFLTDVSPKVAVISAGENNSYGHPHKETLERLEKSGAVVLGTSASGAMRFWKEQDEIRIESWK